MLKKIADLDCWQGSVTPKIVTGGHSNHNYLVEDQGGSFFVRLGQDLDVHCVKRFNEIAIAKAAHAIGISPEIIWHEPGVIVSRYIQGKTLSNQEIAQEEYLSRLIPLLQKCHRELSRNIDGPVISFWIFHVCRNYAAVLRKEPNRQYPDLDQLMKINDSLEQAIGAIEPVVTHNDLLASNFIDDGSKIYIIDWEYAGVNTALFDLACLSSFCSIPLHQETYLLETYYDKQVTEEHYRQFVALKCASELWTYLWSLVAEIHSALDLDFPQIAAGHWHNFNRLWQEFKHL